VVDLRENLGFARLDLSVTSGPELAGGRIPAARLRPTLVRTARVGGGRLASNLLIGDNDPGGAASAIAVDAPADATVTSIDLAVEVSHTRLADLEVAVRPPGGPERIVVPIGSVDNALIVRANDAFAGSLADGNWQVIVRDRVANSQAGRVVEATLAVHQRGGEPPVATAASYESPPLDLGAVVGFDAVDWTARASEKSSVAIRARTCDAAAACASQSWSEPLVRGAAPALTARRFAQYRVELATDGSAVPALDAIEIRYRVAE